MWTDRYSHTLLAPAAMHFIEGDLLNLYTVPPYLPVHGELDTHTANGNYGGKFKFLQFIFSYPSKAGKWHVSFIYGGVLI